MSMPEPPPPEGQPEGGGNFLTRKYAGLPGIVWLGGAAIIAYFLFFRNKSSGSGAPSSSGGGGTSTTGDITFTPPATSVVVGTQSAPVTTDTGSTGTDSGNQGLNPGQGSVSGIPNPQPAPSVPGRSATTATAVPVGAALSATNMRYYTVQAGDTLASIAKKFGISVATLAKANVYVKGEVPGDKKVGQPLGTGAGLKTGQVLKIP